MEAENKLRVPYLWLVKVQAKAVSADPGEGMIYALPLRCTPVFSAVIFFNRREVGGNARREKEGMFFTPRPLRYTPVFSAVKLTTQVRVCENNIYRR